MKRHINKKHRKRYFTTLGQIQCILEAVTGEKSINGIKKGVLLQVIS